ncbi:dynein heavy chain, partial [Trichophyton tonsurans CBS 112818]
MEVVSPGAANGVPSPTVSMTVDPEVVLHYLAEVIQGTLGALRRDLESSGSLLSQAKYSETLQRCGRFASESQIALYAHKDTVVPEQTNGSDDDAEHSHYVYTLSSELSISPTTTAATAVFKPGQPIDPAVPLYSQIQVLTLPGFASLNNPTTPQGPPISPYEIIYSFVHHGLSPYYEACTRGHDGAQGSKGRNDTDPKTGEVRAKQKFAELELALSHLQQNIEIPALSLPLHEIVQAALDEAQSRGIEPSVELVPAAVLDNHAVINSIQNNVNGWIKSIQAITKMSRDPDNGSAVQEINFWLSMETALEGIETALRDAGVQLTMDVLRHAKRFSTTLSFSADTGLKEAMETVQKYNQLLRDFPLDELESATSLQKVQEALNLIFSHLNKKLRICPYPIKRALSLVAAISGDLDLTIHKLIPGRSIMHYDYTEFHSLMRAAQIVWRTWDENIKEFTNVARDAMRRRNEKFIPIKVKPKHAETQDRLKFINTFRTNHEQLQRTIINVLGTKSNQGGASLSAGADNSTALEEFGDVDAVEQVTQAYNALKDVDVLDVSPEGTQAWIQAESAYNERTSRVENLMIARLRDKLATAQNANEKFRVFSKFNALLVRPKIRSAIGEYQTKLIDNVKQDIAALHERFKQQYGHSEAHAMAQLRDLPPVSGAIIWAQQIERQLDGYMRKVEDVLGEDWDLHADGQKLQAESNMFRKKLDTRPIFQAWVQDVKRRNIAISGRLFVITRNRAAGNSLELAVNFDAQIIALFKEVRNLVWLNFQIPHAITSVSKEAKRVYPFAISLMESVRTLHQTIRAIASMSQSAILLNGYQNDVQAYSKGSPFAMGVFHTFLRDPYPSVSSGRGESKHVQFVREFAISTSVLQSKTATLATMDDNIQKAILSLKTCPYDVTVFRNRIDQIQIAIDKLNLENYANLGYWVANLNTKIETILQDRLRGAIRRWIASFQHAGDDQSGTDHTIEASGSKEEQDTSYIQFPKSLHEISMKNQVMHLDPPLEYARASWFAHFDEWVGVLCNLEKIKSSRYKMSIHTDNGSYSETHFSDIPQYCSEELSEVYSLIEARLEEISEYVDKWLQFQSLWDLQSSHVYDILGEDLSQWLQLLHEIRKSRGTFDTSEVRRSFGNVRIDYEQVQTKVNAKYDQWQREILLKFAGKLGARMRDVHAELEAARRDLEGQSLEASSTAQAVSFITIVQQCKRKAKLWEPEIDLFLQGQATLIRQRYQAPSDWLPADRVSGEWDALNEILERRSKTVQDQTDALRAKISAEDRVINEKIAEAVNQWNEEKPVSGSTPPEEASATLSYFQSRLEKLQSESEMVSKAKEALDLPSSPETTLAAILEEVQDFMAVWAALSTIWKSLNELRDTLWSSIQPRKLRQSLDGLIKMTKEMPSRMRQYAAFEHIQNVLRGFLKVNPLLADMKSEAVRERHWQKIFKALKPGKRFSQISMTLGDVWDLQLGPSESVIRDIITQAQGEMALEEFLRSVRETWQSYTLDLVNYQNKCRLIRGFDDLFAKCSENLNSLQAMRHSPYYKEFEEEATTWEDKLTRVHVLFDVWIDVQRQWVYLEGVFTGNADIKHLLPLESGRFQNINSEFFAVMKKVYKSPLVLDVLAITGVQKSLERLAELLHKIQKALGEYLEKERVSFPRFYFVGDEDLLEIIGNSNDTLRVAKHFKKMFAGLSGLLIDDDGNIIGVSSKEGEEVILKREVSLVKTPRINDWLTALDNNVKLTLAELLTEAIEQFEPIYSASEVDSTAFQDYIANYPAQIVVLGSQVVWTNAVQKALETGGGGLSALYDAEVRVLDILALTVLGDLDPITRKKCEHLITEFVHQRDAITKLMSVNASSPTHYLWLLQMRY